MNSPAKRQCQSKNKAGEPCRAAPLTGDDYCIAHTRNPLEKTRFGGAQPGAGRPKAPKISEMMREALAERVEQRVDRMLIVPFEAMEAEKTIVAPNGKIAAVVPDHPVRLKGWTTHGMGRPEAAENHRDQRS